MTYRVTVEELTDLRGGDVYSEEGERIGKVEEVYVDRDTGEPEWIGLGTGFLRSKRVLVPVAGASVREDAVWVGYPKSMVKDAPDVDEGDIDQQTERGLYEYYGVPYSEARSDTQLPDTGRDTGYEAGRAGRRTETEADMTRHEEELRVGTRPVETGRLRLHKWVETEPVQAQVELRRETARVEREPIDAPADAGEIGEQEVEVKLTGEEPVVAKETVAKERVRAGKDVETRTETVSDEVRKERVEAEGEGVEVDDRR
jgi:uncharacterized protein (TIGR02271 family)